jgi:branched-subunit amino acid aminotransferase/4-amino-4-deoxychorismate lyase
MIGLIETVRVMRGSAPLWGSHLRRLESSARALGLPVPALVMPEGDDRVVRIEVRSDGVRIADRPVGSLVPIALATSPAPHRGYPHKVTDRSWLDAARTSVLSLGADDALLLAANGDAVEASQWAIGWWEGELLMFPSLTLGGLPSVARERLNEVVRGGIHDAVLSRNGLNSRSLVACNAARGLVPVAALDGEAVPGNLRTAAVARRFWGRHPG